MKKLLFMLLLCSLLSSCKKENIIPVDYTLYSADVKIYTDNFGGFINLPLHSFKDIKLENGNFTLIPNVNCPESIAICAGIRFIRITKMEIKNKIAYKCK